METMFKIDDKKLFMEKTLVEYDGVPIFFVCKDEYKLYLCLCVDMDEGIYYITETTSKVIAKMLHGKVSMRDAFLQNNNLFWEMRVGDDVENDICFEIQRTKLDETLLPEEGAFFNVVTEDMVNYRNTVDFRNQLEGDWEVFDIESTDISEKDVDALVLESLCLTMIERMTAIVKVSVPSMSLNNYSFSLSEEDSEQKNYIYGKNMEVVKAQLNISSDNSLPLVA